MAKYSAQKNAWTPVAVADTTAFTDNGYIAVQGVASAQFKVTEVYIGGQASSSAVTQLTVSRDSTVGATALSGVTLALIDGTGLAPSTAPNAFSASTTKPQRSSTLQLLNLTLNAFGGIVRWVAAPGYELNGFGASASLGEMSLSSFNAGSPGAVGAHILFEMV